MCGRYTADPSFSDLRIVFKVRQLELFRPWKPVFNIAPSYGPGFEQLIVVRGEAGERVARLARWWFIPASWNRPLKALPSSFNARAEELRTRPFWRAAFRAQRCLVPATGWREFVRTGGRSQPYHFHLGRRPFAFAGLWSRWHSPDGEVVDTFAIITTQPSASAAAIHDRMPLVLPEASYDAWLDNRLAGESTLLDACSRALELELDCYPSDPIANDSRYEGLGTLQPAPIHVPAAGDQLGLFEEAALDAARAHSALRRR